MPSFEQIRDGVALLKDIATIFATLFGGLTLFIVFLKLRVEHPGYKLVLERELALFSEVNKLEEELEPVLTRTSEKVELPVASIRALRGKVKRLAASIYASDELRDALYGVSEYLRDGSLAKAETYAVDTKTMLDRWRHCTNAMRRRIRVFASADRPFRLFTFDTRTGQYVFVDSFATKRARERYEKDNPLPDDTKRYDHWPDGEDVGLITRFLR